MESYRSADQPTVCFPPDVLGHSQGPYGRIASPLGDGVVAVSAARTTSSQPPDTHPYATQWPKSLHTFVHVLRTARLKAAGPGEQPGKRHLVAPDEPKKRLGNDPAHQAATPARAIAKEMATRRSDGVASIPAGRSWTMHQAPARSSKGPTAVRSRRFKRFLSTECAARRFPTANPHSPGDPSFSGEDSTRNVNHR